MTNACQWLPIYSWIPRTIDWLALPKWCHSFAIAGKRSLSWSGQSRDVCICRVEVVVAVHADTCLHPQSVHVNGANTHIHAQHSSSYTLPPLQLVWPRIARRLHSSALPPLLPGWGWTHSRLVGHMDQQWSWRWSVHAHTRVTLLLHIHTQEISRVQTSWQHGLLQ